MIIDFKEIAAANKGGGEQDHFEFFSRDFLKAHGYKIIRHPDRGPDGKKDLIISETIKGLDGETTINWLVSCKHHAHSDSAVKDTDEPDIVDRVNAHNCQGFIGVYSTLPASSLSNKLYAIADRIPNIIYDCARIEETILRGKQYEQLFLRYFPISYANYKEQIKEDINEREKKETDSNIFNNHIKDETKKDQKEKTYSTTLTEEDLLRINVTAIIVVEIEKIKEKYWRADWDKRNEILEEIVKYIDQTSPRLAREIFLFLSDIAGATRAGMPYSSAISVYGMALNFFPGLYGEDDYEEKSQIAKQCIHIGSNIAYDAFIHLRNLAIAMVGLSIIKFIYRSAKENDRVELKKEVSKTYDNLKIHLNRPERQDLGEAQELLKIFKDDLEEWDLAFPILPLHLEKRVRVDEKK